MFIVVHPCSSSVRATSTLLDEVRLHQGHPLCMKSWLQCFQEFLQIKAHILQLLCKTNSLKLHVPLEFGVPWILGSLNYPCTPPISSLESSMLHLVNEPLRLQERLERPPSPLEVEWDYSLPLKPWLIPINLLERTNLHHRESTPSKTKWF